MGRKKILLFCETVTLAHLVRPLALAQSLPPDQYEVIVASGEIAGASHIIPKDLKVIKLLTSVPSHLFLSALAKGKIPYHSDLLASQVLEDLRLIEQIKPDLVIGDFRLSLGISARIAKVRYMNITNITWHKSAKIAVQVPEIPVVKILGEKLSQILFKYIRPFVFALMAHPFNKVARQFQQKPFGSLMDVYTSGDVVFYADPPGIVTTDKLPSSHHLAGPIFGSMNAPTPIQQQDEQSLPLVLVSLGSSGPQHLLSRIIEGLLKLPVRIMVSTSGQEITYSLSDSRLIVTKFLPLDYLLGEAQLVVCNGGSPTVYSALANGVAVLAIPSNLDQFNVTEALKNHEVLSRIRPAHLTKDKVENESRRLLYDPQVQKQLKKMRQLIRQSDAKEYFCRLVSQLT